ncbi:MAG TPA: hypothetical protein VJT50_04390, partial [Pyrinomonadaceae bacterium]|nr:hypothetical protein [Pyrinomonadaceae bacterium]
CLRRSAVYKPKFCCECGNKIVRLRWRPWQSRMFCKACARHFRRERFAPAIVVVVVMLVGGYIVGRSRVPPPPPLIIERRADSPLNDSASGQSSGASLIASVPTASVEDDIYTCGARTKKGTPCSRRVHGPVRCWQHKGMPAMLPQEKLRVQQ